MDLSKDQKTVITQYKDDPKNRYNSFLVDPSGKYLANQCGYKIIFYDLDTLQRHNKIRYGSHFIERCAFHPVNKSIAIVESSGLIRLVHSYHLKNDKKQKTISALSSTNSITPKLPVNSSSSSSSTPATPLAVVEQALHWHHESRTHISFTPSGLYLVSGGQEAVLVFWNLLTGQKTFFPRLKAPIYHVCTSKDDKLISAATNSNTVFIFDFTQAKLLTKIQGLKTNVVDDSTGILSLNGEVVKRADRGSIQWWNMEKEEAVKEVVIIEKINKGGSKEERQGGEISKIGFGGPSSKWMGVACLWNNFGVMKEIQLRFYLYSKPVADQVGNSDAAASKNKKNKKKNRVYKNVGVVNAEEEEKNRGYETHTVVYSPHEQEITFEVSSSI